MEVRFVRTKQEYIQELPVVDGQFIVLTDADGMYYDMNGERHTVTGVQTIDYSEAINKPKINDIELSGNITLDQLGVASKEDLSKVESIAKGAQSAKAFASYTNLVNGLKNTEYETYRVGQSLFINTLNVPDVWVCGKTTTFNDYKYEDDDKLISDLNSSPSGVNIGYYLISPLETQKVNLNDYVPTSIKIAGESLSSSISASTLAANISSNLISNSEFMNSISAFLSNNYNFAINFAINSNFGSAFAESNSTFWSTLTNHASASKFTDNEAFRNALGNNYSFGKLIANNDGFKDNLIEYNGKALADYMVSNLGLSSDFAKALVSNTDYLISYMASNSTFGTLLTKSNSAFSTGLAANEGFASKLVQNRGIREGASWFASEVVNTDEFDNTMTGKRYWSFPEVSSTGDIGKVLALSGTVDNPMLVWSYI